MARTKYKEDVVLETYAVAGIASACFAGSYDFYNLATPKTVITCHWICELDPR